MLRARLPIRARGALHTALSAETDCAGRGYCLPVGCLTFPSHFRHDAQSSPVAICRDGRTHIGGYGHSRRDILQCLTAHAAILSTEAPSQRIPQYLTTRISLLAMTHLVDTSVSRYSRRAGVLPWPLGSGRASIGNRGPSASRPRVGWGWRNLNRQTRAGSAAAASG